jgi:hypothetical protein
MFPKKLVKNKIVAYCKAAFLETGLKISEAEPVTLNLRSSRYTTRPNNLTRRIAEQNVSQTDYQKLIIFDETRIHITIITKCATGPCSEPNDSILHHISCSYSQLNSSGVM